MLVLALIHGGGWAKETAGYGLLVAAMVAIPTTETGDGVHAGPAQRQLDGLTHLSFCHTNRMTDCLAGRHDARTALLLAEVHFSTVQCVACSA